MFGKEKERRRQWALLGKLLRGMRLLEALDFLHAAYGTEVMRWDMLREAVSRGDSLAGLAGDYGHGKIPDDVLQALREGEKDGLLPQHLEELLDPERATPGREEGNERYVELVNRFLLQMAEKGIPRLEMSPKGVSAVGIDVPDALMPAMIRRLWIMAGQPYWKPEAATFRMRTPKGALGFRLSPVAGGAVVVEVS